MNIRHSTLHNRDPIRKLKGILDTFWNDWSLCWFQRVKTSVLWALDQINKYAQCLMNTQYTISTVQKFKIDFISCDCNFFSSHEKNALSYLPCLKRDEFLLSPFDYAQTRYDVWPRREISFCSGFEYTWNSKVYSIYLNYAILQEHHRLTIFAEEFPSFASLVEKSIKTLLLFFFLLKRCLHRV